MNFQDLVIKKEYRSLIDNVVKEFYIPLLNNAILYKRAVGYFSSSSLVEISKGITGLAKNDGKIQLVASPYLSVEDLEAIKKGYEERNYIIEKSLRDALTEPKNYFEKERLNLLANLIAIGQLDIRIAFTENKKALGLYHEKMGILYDPNDNKIAFSGSMNETSSGMRLNYEAIDVFCSWKNKNDNERIILKENSFTSIWNNFEPNIIVMEFQKIKDEFMNKYKYSSINFDIDQNEFFPLISNNVNTDTENPPKLIIRIPENVELYNYQQDAISEWEKNNFRGIFDMATGTGKTITGLAGIAKLYDFTKGKLAVIIVCPFQHLVEQWVEDIVTFNIKPIIGYSASSQSDWKTRLEKSIRDQKIGVKNSEFFCFVCTNATFSSNFVQGQVKKIHSNALLLVDEAHNFGAEKLLGTLSTVFNYRLALSATLERHNDELGTEKLKSYFGAKCIEYPLERAISEKKLTPYYYHPVLVNLSETEWDMYLYLSREIGKCVSKDKNGVMRLNEKGKKIAIKRARLVAAAEQKISKLQEVIEPYRNDNHILVYCGAASLLENNDNSGNVLDQDIRQIDAITDMLGNYLKMKVSQFTSKEDIREREVLKREFSKGENLQALIAIKCLDEGVNIPKIKIAFILASTTNPKEYIQRRGRVLRLAEGKRFATIYDFITLPRPLLEVPYLTHENRESDLGLVKKELCRAEEFSRISLNSIESFEIIDNIREAYELQREVLSYEEF